MTFEDERKVGLLLGFSEEMSQMGKKPGSLVLSAKTVKADDRLQQRLRVPKGCGCLRTHSSAHG